MSLCIAFAVALLSLLNAVGWVKLESRKLLVSLCFCINSPCCSRIFNQLYW